jgi:diaminopimelate epimerase
MAGVREFRYWHVDAGVPHAVIRAGAPGDLRIEELGRAIRQDPVFGPAGVNVDFVDYGPDGTVLIRTYERGVERETLACGSGCVAAALVAELDRPGRGPVTLRVASGDLLEVDLSPPGEEKATLSGPARIVFEGRADLKELSDV